MALFVTFNARGSQVRTEIFFQTIWMRRHPGASRLSHAAVPTSDCHADSNPHLPSRSLRSPARRYKSSARSARGRPMREIINGIFYVMRAGCPWRLLPNDLPPWGTIYRWFAAWRDNG